MLPKTMQSVITDSFVKEYVKECLDKLAKSEMELEKEEMDSQQPKENPALKERVAKIKK
jgi:hypothetical protein